jgi:tetratricopeptide (TPR) repeat protein
MKKLIFMLIACIIFAGTYKTEAISINGHKTFLQKDSVKTQINKAQSLISQGKKGEASKILKGVIQSNPDNKDAVRLWLNANMNMSSNPDKDALRSLEQLEKSYPDHTAIMFWKSYLQAENGQNEEALAGFTRLTEVQPDSAVNWVGKGQLLAGMNKHKEALEAFDKATSLAPQRYDIWEMKAGSHAKTGNFDEAIASVNKALEIAPNDPVSIYNRACFYSLKGDKANALTDLKKAFSLDPSFKEYAKKDPDLKSLWEDAEFKKMAL